MPAPSPFPTCWFIFFFRLHADAWMVSFQGHTASSSAAALSEAVDILSQIDFFQDLSEEALASVASVFTVWAYDPGQGGDAMPP